MVCASRYVQSCNILMPTPRLLRFSLAFPSLPHGEMDDIATLRMPQFL